MTLVGLVILAVATYMMMRRRGRVFLEPEEAIVMGVFALLAIVQRLASGSVNLNDHFITPIYFALPVVVGHARGPARGATSSILGAAVICVLAAALQPDQSVLRLSQIPGQYVILPVLLGFTGAGSGLKHVPKALKPLLSATWILFVAIYHPEYLQSTAAYVTLFTSISLAALGLYFNPFKPQTVTIHYPSTPSRRD